MLKDHSKCLDFVDSKFVSMYLIIYMLVQKTFKQIIISSSSNPRRNFFRGFFPVFMTYFYGRSINSRLNNGLAAATLYVHGCTCTRVYGITCVLGVEVCARVQCIMWRTCSCTLYAGCCGHSNKTLARSPKDYFLSAQNKSKFRHILQQD